MRRARTGLERRGAAAPGTSRRRLVGLLALRQQGLAPPRRLARCVLRQQARGQQTLLTEVSW